MDFRNATILSGGRDLREIRMRQSLFFSAAKTLTLTTTLFALVTFAGSAIAEQKPANPKKKAIGNVESGDATVAGKQAGKSKRSTVYASSPNIGDITTGLTAKKKKTRPTLGDIVITKKPDKGSPLLSGPATATGANKALTRGGLLEGQGSLGTAGPSATGSPAMPASPRGGGAVIR
jgi:hypothetical protein